MFAGHAKNGAVAGVIALSAQLAVKAQPAHAIDICDSGPRHTCVVDGDTLWLEGTKYRLASFDTPEPRSNICGGAEEVALARRATARLVELLNANQWQLVSLGREDRYDRVLANIEIDGEDIGDILIREGLARAWPDGSEFWCR